MDWGQLIQVILEAMLALVLPVVVKLGFDWLRKRVEEIEVGLGERRWWMVKEAVAIAVRAAEQSGLATELINTGAEKKRYAIDFCERYLTEMGLGGLDLDILADLIESEVWKQFNDKPVGIFEKVK